MRRFRLVAVAGVAALAVAFAVPASSVASSTTTFVTRSDGKLAFAAWQLNDAYNTSIQVGGNDLMFLNAGGYNQPGVPAYHVNGVLLTVNQDFCDTTTDEEVFRELSVFPDVGANVAMVNDALNRASVIGTLDLSGIEVRTPNCAAPDYGQRSFSFPTFPVQLNLRWDAPKGNNTVNSHFEIHYPDYCGMFSSCR